MAATINSVTGPLEPTSLGYILPHEHVLVSAAGIPHVYPEFIDRGQVVSDATGDLTVAANEDVRTIIDLTTVDLGREVQLLEQVARESGVQIICATGTWRDIPRPFWTAEIDQIASLYIREIEEGIEGTGIKAGIIKVANDKGGVTPEGEIILRAAARAQKATGVPISTHTWALERVGDQQVRIFEDEGVDLQRVYIGHCNDTTDIDYLAGLAEKGVWLGMDRFPGGRHEGTPQYPERLRTIKALVEAGYANRLMLSHDWTSALYSVSQAERARRRRDENPQGFSFIPRTVVPDLRQLGVTDAQLAEITLTNPHRLFGAA